VRGDEATCELIEAYPISDVSWGETGTELAVTVGVVTSLGAAAAHINGCSGRLTDRILTESPQRAEIFHSRFRSGAVYVNAPTTLTSGPVFDLGSDIAISPGPQHARGPVGMRHLRTI